MTPHFEAVRRSADTPTTTILGFFAGLELLVTVALLSVIIIGLVAMFSQTRRAFTSTSITQVDVLESGPFGGGLGCAGDGARWRRAFAGNVSNFFVFSPRYFNNLALPDPAAHRQWIRATVNPARTTCKEVYFVTRYNQQWNLIGYRLFSATTADGVGTLYRFSVPNIALTNVFQTNNIALSTVNLF